MPHVSPKISFGESLFPHASVLLAVLLCSGVAALCGKALSICCLFGFHTWVSAHLVWFLLRFLYIMPWEGVLDGQSLLLVPMPSFTKAIGGTVLNGGYRFWSRMDLVNPPPCGALAGQPMLNYCLRV